MRTALLDFRGPDRNAIKQIWSDGAREFNKVCVELDIANPTSTPYEHTSNARAERSNQHILAGTRTILETSGLGVRLWPYACQHWCFSENTRAIEGDCSYRRRFGRWSKAKQIPFGALVDFLPPER